MEKTLSDTAQVCKRYSISRSTLWRRLKSCQLPPPITINGRNYWLDEVLDEHIAGLFGEGGEDGKA